MLVEVRVPQLSESVAEATLLEWHKKVGEHVARDENLIDIETDKVVLELPAPAEGVLVKILRNSKGTVTSGEVIATIDTEGVGALVRMGVDLGRKARPNLKVGICGEHGGDAASIHFFEKAGLDYVSASPYRIPVARLAAAQAAMQVKVGD